MKVKLTIDGKEYEIEITEEQAKYLTKKKTGYERVEREENYFIAIHFGTIMKQCDTDSDLDGHFYSEANYYSDKSVAKNNARADKLYRQLRRFAVEHRDKAFDWKETNQKKFSIAFGFASMSFTVKTVLTLQEFGQIYFDSEKTAQLAIDTFKDELMWYFTEYRDSL